MARRLKLEINHKLEQMRDKLPKSIAVLNLPVAFHCAHMCKGCVSRRAGREMIKKERKEALPKEDIRKIIDYFKDKYDTKFITVNGRGDPFHPEVKDETYERIMYAFTKGMQSYVFTAGDNLNEPIPTMLAEFNANVMISLFGNGFIDADFFKSTVKYEGQRAKIAYNIRTLMSIYQLCDRKPEEGLTRIGMNYVVRETDLKDRNRLAELKEATNEKRIFFICNTDFFPNEDPEIQKKLQVLAIENSDFNLVHSTAINDICQMGAGSSATIAPNGDLYRCPYMMEGSDGNFITMSEKERARILAGYMIDKRYACAVRKTIPAQR